MSALPDDDEETAEETRLLNEMDLEEALNGSETRDKKCPFFFFNFMRAARRPIITKDSPATPEQVKVFSIHPYRGRLIQEARGTFFAVET